MEEIKTITVEKPKWLLERGLNEQVFCEEFLFRYPMKFCGGSFYGLDGWISEDKVKRLIFGQIHQFVIRNIAKVTNQLLEALRISCMAEELPIQETRIHCRNGTYNLMEDELISKKEICRCRLPVNFNRSCPEPKQWLKFLSELLYEEDILTLQEFVGYCLLPVNYAQKMLLIIGEGGEGKSRIGIVLSHLLGTNMVNGSLSKLETSPFARADLQGKLLLVDDDLRLEGLRSTNYLKTIITAEQPLDLERKGVQSYQGKVSCRLMAFGNGSLRALHDRSYGFFRRQIILSAKPRDPNRVDDPYLAGRLFKELPGILLWCLEGLYRLLGQQMQFTLSQKSQENLRLAISEGDNVRDFLESQGYFRLDKCGTITSRQLYALYNEWCQDNAATALSSKTFIHRFSLQSAPLDIHYSTNIDGGCGRRVRGFTGLRLLK